MPILRGLTLSGGQALGTADSPAFSAVTLDASREGATSGTIAASKFEAGAKSERLWWTETLVIDTAAPSVTSHTLPAGCTILAVYCRVTVTIPSPTTMIQVEDDAGGAVIFVGYGEIGVSAGSSVVGIKSLPHTRFDTAEAGIRVTPDSYPGTNAGRLEIVCLYEVFTPMTS